MTAAAAAGALMLLTVPAVQAAPTASAACITAKEDRDFGRGEISLCPQSDGSTRVTGFVEDLMPGWFPDARCVGWSITMGSTSDIGPLICPHFSSDPKVRKDFDYVEKFAAPVTGARLGAFSA
ncbi:hypothetical protein ACFYVL_44110 [Streptomyces sp. NPDC004111]|uniref:hypothetical protein n=1 Tax=Streptomyces sp. NPDC004111 TaxID=3364690 RepID=UPI0036758F25